MLLSPSVFAATVTLLADKTVFEGTYRLDACPLRVNRCYYMKDMEMKNFPKAARPPKGWWPRNQEKDTECRADFAAQARSEIEFWAEG